MGADVGPRVDPEPHYKLAVKRLGLDPEEDAAAARRLSELLAEQKDQVVDPGTLASLFQDRTVAVLGPARGGIRAIRSQVPQGTPIVVAGSAVRLAFEHELHPWLVVTDLDGDAGAHRALSTRGAPMAVHAHGDNTELLDALVPTLEGPLFGTCQPDPPEDASVPLHRFGGFTDGDRACFLAAALGARELWLAGWDLEAPVGGGEGKAEKLSIARELLEEVPVGVTVLAEQGHDELHAHT